MTIQNSQEKIWATVQELVQLTPEEARQKLNLGVDTSEWRIDAAQQDLKSSGPTQYNIVPIYYRPFDIRYTYYTGQSVGFHSRPRRSIMQHFIGKDNLGLITTRQTKDEWGATVTRSICDRKCCAAYDVNSLFPLYLYSEGLFGVEKRPNISEKYLAELAAIVGEAPTPETIFGYIYARLHSPLYRARFAAFLKTDFPRVPMPDSRAAFESLSALGAQLVALHTLDGKAAPVLKLKRHALGEGSDTVQKPRYDATARRVWINETQGFDDVDAGVYNHKIGGYQVAEKWLADRRGRTLSFEERRLYPQILIALAETRRIMAKIDEVNDDE